MEFIIRPYIGVGKIHLGMSANEIEEAMGVRPEKIRKFDDDEYETDCYEWCHIFYKDPGVCEAIELFAPAIVTFNSENLIGKSYSVVKSYVSQFDNELHFDETGFTSLKFGFGVYAPFAESDPQESVEGVIVFEKNYYD